MNLVYKLKKTNDSIPKLGQIIVSILSIELMIYFNYNYKIIAKTYLKISGIR